jgi:hypothetical protein
MNKQIEIWIKDHPALKALFGERFKALPTEKQEFIIELVEDAKFWLELEKGQEHPDDGFKFLAASFGLMKAQTDADEDGLKGRERDEYLRPHQDLFTQYNPYSGRTSD